METLPDYLQNGLDLVFVGINPGLTSAQRGHYFSNPRNRFWMAFNAAQMTPTPLGPDTDGACLTYGIGMTDVVKRPTNSMAELKPAEFTEGVVVLEAKLLHYQPLVVCFNGVTGYRYYMKQDSKAAEAKVGLQEVTIGRSKVWVLPSTSPANAAVPPERIVACMRELKQFIRDLKNWQTTTAVLNR
jgi:TDG/mug DNA glycosylase family protein